MRKLTMLAVAVAVTIAVATFAGPASAQDVDPCPDGLVCASKPSSVYALVRTMEPKAKLTKDDDGRPMIEVDGPSYRYSIRFMDCEENAKCAAITFSANFKKEKIIDIGFANRWNANHRVPKGFINEEGVLYLQMEISTVGGLTRENFRDWKKWWDSGLSEFGDFYDKEAADRDPKNRT